MFRCRGVRLIDAPEHEAGILPAEPERVLGRNGEIGLARLAMDNIQPDLVIGRLVVSVGGIVWFAIERIAITDSIARPRPCNDRSRP